MSSAKYRPFCLGLFTEIDSAVHVQQNIDLESGLKPGNISEQPWALLTLIVNDGYCGVGSIDTSTAISKATCSNAYSWMKMYEFHVWM